jgi:hypothetical protein
MLKEPPEEARQMTAPWIAADATLSAFAAARSAQLKQAA